MVSQVLSIMGVLKGQKIQMFFIVLSIFLWLRIVNF